MSKQFPQFPSLFILMCLTYILSHQLCWQLLGTPFAMTLYDNHFQQWEHPEPKDACHDPTGQKSHLHKDNCKFTLKSEASLAV